MHFFGSSGTEWWGEDNWILKILSKSILRIPTDPCLDGQKKLYAAETFTQIEAFFFSDFFFLCKGFCGRLFFGGHSDTPCISYEWILKGFLKALLFFSYLGPITLCRPFIWRRAEKNHDSWVKFKFNLVGNCNCYCIIAKLLGETPTYFLYWASFNFIVRVRQSKSKAFRRIIRKALKKY